MKNNLKESALMYAKLYGFAVFPLKPCSKHPATPHGFKDATTDPEQITKWWSENPNYNIGWATGNASGGAVVIDLDEDDEKDKHGYDTLRKWEQEHHATLPETWAVMTGRGGYHLIYREPNTQQNSLRDLYDGIDVRANKGYGILPPSIHPNGNPYQWEQGAGDGMQIAPINEVIREFLKGDEPEPVKGKRFKSPEIIPEGQRTDILVRELCSLHSKGLSDGAIRAALREENEEKCEPPLTEQELEKEVFPALSRYKKGTPKKEDPRENAIQLVSMNEITEQSVEWLEYPYIPKGKITLVGAYPGVGKTYFMCYVAACVSRGKSIFNRIPFEHNPGNVIFLSAEDSAEDTLKARLRQCDADMTKVFTVTEGATQLLFNSPEIECFLQQVRPTCMIFDPFQSYVSADLDLNAANKTREALGHVIKIAKDFGVAIVLICHLNKNIKSEAITRIIGSTDIVGASRSYLALGNVPGENTKFLSHEKASLSERGKTLLWQIKPDEGGIVFAGESDLSFDDYAALGRKARSGSSAIEGAKEFLIANMPEGSRAASELLTLADSNRISRATLDRARKELKIVSRRVNGYQKGTVWELPKNTTP